MEDTPPMVSMHAMSINIGQKQVVCFWHALVVKFIGIIWAPWPKSEVMPLVPSTNKAPDLLQLKNSGHQNVTNYTKW